MVFIEAKTTSDHYYSVYVVVSDTAECPHGGGPTKTTDCGVKIDCPSGRDCWLVKWEREAKIWVREQPRLDGEGD